MNRPLNNFIRPVDVRRSGAQRGESLLSSMLWMIGAAAVMAICIQAYYWISIEQKSKDEAAKLALILQSTKDRYLDGEGRSFAGLTNARLVTMGVVPPQMVSGTNVIRNGFGTTVTFQPGDNGTGAGTAISATTTVRSHMCPMFVRELSRHVQRITVGGTIVLNDQSGDTVVTAADLANCGAQSAQDTDTIVVLAY